MSEMWFIIKECVLNIFLFWGTCQDIKEQKISSFYLKIGGVMAVIFTAWEFLNDGFWEYAQWLAFFPGALFFLWAIYSKEKIGKGDGYIFLLMPAFLEWKRVWSICQISLLLCIAYSFFMLLRKKIHRGSKIAYVPFIWLAHTITWGIGK